MRYGTTSILVGAIAVSAVWAGLTHEPERAREPYPLPATEQAAQVRWVEQVEQVFGLDRGVGARAMTEQEWNQHQQKMAAMAPAERFRYQEEIRNQIAERLRDKQA